MSSNQPRTRAIPLTAALITATCLLAAPAAAQRSPGTGDLIPPGYQAIQRMRPELVTAGAVTFGVTYVLTGLGGAIGADAGCSGCTSLLVPVVGPFLMMPSTESVTGRFALALDGITQVAGVTMFVVGLAAPRTILVRSDLAKTRIVPTPMRFGNHGTGLGLVGTF
ncbi:MAG: hypothetical protein QM820_37110 [Minicystis sp.]